MELCVRRFWAGVLHCLMLGIEWYGISWCVGKKSVGEFLSLYVMCMCVCGCVSQSAMPFICVIAETLYVCRYLYSVPVIV